MQKTRKAILIFLFLLMVYTLLRLIFYELYFSRSSFLTSPGKAFYWGFRLDISAIFYSNLLFFLYYFLVPDNSAKRVKYITGVLLLSLINLPLLAVNVIDLAYYAFNLRRSTVDLFRVLAGSLPALNAWWNAWWWLFLLFVVVAILMVLVFAYILKLDTVNKDYLRSNLLPGICFLFPLGLLARGFSDRPIIPSTPLLYLPAPCQPLATNSTITILYSIIKRQSSLQKKSYFSDLAMDTLFTAKQQLQTAKPFTKMNVVVFLLESFAKEYMDKSDSLQAKTPFLDSIMLESIVCNNAYANGMESNKGIVATLASIPPFFDEPYYYSAYSNNALRGIGTLLKEQGYTTNFFMGAGYDHFGFGRLCKLIGIDNYYSKDDYGNGRHYDGNWGIYDHYFLPYAARTMSQMKKPFFSTVFTISTHFPYTLPDTLRSRFTIKGQQSEQNSMSYLDYSLRLFFDAIKDEPWYTNTLFVFSADHNIFWHLQEKATLYKRFRIPIFFYLPGQRKRQDINKPVQQLDIIPTVLDLLHYKHPFMSFGKSVLDTLSPGITVNRLDDLYQAIDSAYLFGYNEKTEQPVYLYNFRADPALKENLLLGDSVNSAAVPLQQHLKAVLQYFNAAMIKNRLYIK